MDPIHIFQNGRHFQNGRQPIKKRRKYRGADRLLRSFTNQMKYYNTLLLIMLIIKNLCKKHIYYKYFVNFVLFVRWKGHFFWGGELCFFGKYSFTLIINKSIKQIIMVRERRCLLQVLRPIIFVYIWKENFISFQKTHFLSVTAVHINDFFG